MKNIKNKVLMMVACVLMGATAFGAHGHNHMLAGDIVHAIGHVLGGPSVVVTPPPAPVVVTQPVVAQPVVAPTVVTTPVTVPQYTYGYYNNVYCPTYSGYYYYNNAWVWGGGFGHRPPPPMWHPHHGGPGFHGGHHGPPGGHHGGHHRH